MSIIVRNQRDIVSHGPLEVHSFVLFMQWVVSRYSTEDENSGRLEMVQMEATAVWAKKVVMWSIRLPRASLFPSSSSTNP